MKITRFIYMTHIIVIIFVASCRKDNVSAEMNISSTDTLLVDSCSASDVIFYRFGDALPSHLSLSEKWEYAITQLYNNKNVNIRHESYKDSIMYVNENKRIIDSLKVYFEILSPRSTCVLVLKEFTSPKETIPHRVDVFSNGKYFDNIYAPIITNYENADRLQPFDRMLFHWEKKDISLYLDINNYRDIGIKISGNRIKMIDGNRFVINYYLFKEKAPNPYDEQVLLPKIVD